MSDTAAIAAAKAHQAIMDMADAFREAERERICRIIDANVCKCTEDCTRIDMFGDDLIALIHGERVAHLENLRRLADETGEYDSFYNPLIKGDETPIVQDNDVNYIMGDDNA